MTYSAETKPGMGDPYWYEWSVGQVQILEMLKDNSNIEYVELQADIALGLDDVVVTYSDGSVLCIQVKHTRADDTLTFGDLVAASEGKNSILKELANSWNEEKNHYSEIKTQIYTNRKKGTVKSTASSKNAKYKRPALTSFWSSLNQKLNLVKDYSEIEFPDYPEAWNEWSEQLSGIQESKDKIRFLKSLSLETEQADLKMIEQKLLQTLQELFHANAEQAEILLGRLDHALRIWSASTRPKSRISVEDVYSALSINHDEVAYNHDLIPSEPFFKSRNRLVEEIEDELVNGNEKVIFMSGLPGIGKTNIVSKLCNKRESLINFRYYSYEPIQPDKEYLPMDVSKRVTADNFWKELFSQLRRHLQGDLHKYKVPVLNTFMSLEEIKQEFFRILADVVNEKHISFVIAIDGIDHAARAGAVETFLNTIPHPQYIPNGVKLLITGQPESSYGNYPLWLRSQNGYVKKITVPLISREDISSLVVSKLPDSRASEFEAITDIVHSYSKGNTLSAIFAIHEALIAKDAIELEQTLITRSLSGNIENYYQNIWENVVNKLSRYGFMDYRLAGVFALFNERVDENVLFNMFPEFCIPTIEWKNILKALRPLLIEDEGYYTILHNDVRVFFSGILKIDGDYVQEVANCIAQYYLNQTRKSVSFYHDVIRILEMAERYNDVATLLTPDFAIESYVNKVSCEELLDVGKKSLHRIISADSIDWIIVQRIYTFFATISQIEMSKEELKDSYDFREQYVFNGVRYHECYVEPIEKWTSMVISQVLECITELYENGKIQRAVDTYNRWFNELSIKEIWQRINDEDLINHPRFDDDEKLSDTGKNIAIMFGKNICWSGNYDCLLEVPEGDVESDFIFYLSDSMFNEICKNAEVTVIQKGIRSCSVITMDSLLQNLEYLLRHRNYSRIAVLEEALRERLLKTEIGFVIDCFMRIVSGNLIAEEENIAKRFSEIKNKIDIPSRIDKNELILYLILSTVNGYIDHWTDRIISTGYVTGLFAKTNSHKNQSYYAVLFNVLTYLGRWLYSIQSQTPFYENEKELHDLLSRLFLYKWPPGDRDYRFFPLSPIVLIAIIDLAKETDLKYKQEVELFFDEMYSDFSISRAVEPGLYFYKDDEQKIKEWSVQTLGKNGSVWELPIGERNEYIHKFINSVNEYDISNVVDLQEILERARWSVIGYASHKEYSIYELLEWYKILVNRDRKYISKYAKEIMTISGESSEAGDNRASWDVDRKLYSDLFGEGLEMIINLITSPEDAKILFENTDLLAKGIIGYIDNQKALSKNTLLALWVFINGILDWRDSSTHKEFRDAIISIKNAANSQNFVISDDELKCFGAGGYNTIFLKEKKYGMEEENRLDKFSSPEEIIESYLTTNKENIYSSDVVECLKQIKFDEEKYNSFLLKLIRHEFTSDFVGLQYESLKNYLLQEISFEEAENIIRIYINQKLLGSEKFYITGDLLELTKDMACHLSVDYCETALKNIISMQKSWISSAGHLQISISQNTDTILNSPYYSLMDLKDNTTIIDLCFRWLLTYVLSDDADLVLIALRGLFQYIHLNKEYLLEIEKYWSLFHYRAKEWMLMTYELLITENEEFGLMLCPIIKKHTKDPEFNVAIYAWIIIQKFFPQEYENLTKEKQIFFDDIPVSGHQKMLYAPNNNPWVTELSYTYNSLRRLEQTFQEKYVDIEKRIVAYNNKHTFDYQLIRSDKRKQIGVVLYPMIKSMFDVLYKEWFDGHWNDEEYIDIARIILSGSEPFTLFETGEYWFYNNGKLIDDVDQILLETSSEQDKKLMNCLEEGINESEMVIGGMLIDYSHTKELHAYLISYWDSDINVFVNPESSFEFNKRFLWHDLDDYYEDIHSNIILLNKGIESFRDTLIPCVFSQTVLDNMNWYLKFDSGFKLYNEQNEQIGHFELFYSDNHDFYNRTNSNMPLLQRWVINKDAFKALEEIADVERKLLIIPHEAHQ